MDHLKTQRVSLKDDIKFLLYSDLEVYAIYIYLMAYALIVQ